MLMNLNYILITTIVFVITFIVSFIYYLKLKINLLTSSNKKLEANLKDQDVVVKKQRKVINVIANSKHVDIDTNIKRMQNKEL